MKKIILLVFCLSFFFLTTPNAYARWVFVVKLADNGTIAVSNWPNAEKEDTYVRMYGVTLPTLKQPFGKEALAFLSKFLQKGEKIEVTPVIQEDEEGFEEVLVQVNGHSLNYALVDEGLAWVNRQSCKSTYCRRWYIVEHRAVLAQKGVWSLQKETPPWQWAR